MAFGEFVHKISNCLYKNQDIGNIAENQADPSENNDGISLLITRCLLSLLKVSEPVHQTVGDPRPACPGVDVGTLLAGPHVPHAGLVPQVANLRLVAPRGTVLERIVSVVGSCIQRPTSLGLNSVNI